MVIKKYSNFKNYVEPNAQILKTFSLRKRLQKTPAPR